MSFYFNEPSGIAGLLELVERGCERCMKTGGGGLSAEALDNRGERIRRITPEQIEQAKRLIISGHYSGTEIGRMVGSNQTTIHKLAARMGVKLRDGRIIENRRRTEV